MGLCSRRCSKIRFKLKLHRETGEIPVYELTVAKGGIKMQQLKEGSCAPVDFAFLTQCPPVPLADLPKGQEYCGGVSTDGSRWVGSSDTMDGPKVTGRGTRYESRRLLQDRYWKQAGPSSD
jgi:hypothetical protein